MSKPMVYLVIAAPIYTRRFSEDIVIIAVCASRDAARTIMFDAISDKPPDAKYGETYIKRVELGKNYLPGSISLMPPPE